MLCYQTMEEILGKTNIAKKDFFVYGVIGLIALAIFALVFVRNLGKDTNTKDLTTFAQCLTQKGVKMYGTYWCPHCIAQKAMFGDAFKYVNYTECQQVGAVQGTQSAECNAAGIAGYPTWRKVGGGQVAGQLTIENLAEFSGCPLP